MGVLNITPDSFSDGGLFFDELKAYKQGESMINDGASVLTSFSWPIVFPGFIFSLMIFCMNFIGDGLRDALDPRIS